MMNALYFIYDIWDVVTRPNNLGAVLFIVVIQYRSSLIDFAYTAWEDGIGQTFFSLILDSADVARGYYHAGRETIRNLGNGKASNSFFVGHSRHNEGHSEEQMDTTCDRTKSGRGRKRHSSHNTPPPLVVVGTNSIKSNVSGNDISDRISRSTRMAELEPAFLKEADYPEGWLVYHSVLGVTSVQEASEYTKRSLSSTRPSQQNCIPMDASCLRAEQETVLSETGGTKTNE